MKKLKQPYMFTFKTTKPTGRYKSFESSTHDIKIKGKWVGSIDDEFPYKLRFMVHKEESELNENEPCTWKWIVLTKRNESIQGAKDWLNKNFEAITTKFKLRQSD